MHAILAATVGFVRVGGPRGLIGSGTLVLARGQPAILTADRVLLDLPRSGRVGIVLSPRLNQVSVPADGLRYVSLADGPGAVTPELGLIRLSPAAADVIGRVKAFWEPGTGPHVDHVAPVEAQGAWRVSGFLDERTATDFPLDGFDVIESYASYLAAGHPRAGSAETDPAPFDLDLSAQPGIGAAAWLGLRGGGAWRVPTEQAAERGAGREPLLAGVVLSVRPAAEGRAAARCLSLGDTSRTLDEALLAT